MQGNNEKSDVRFDADYDLSLVLRARVANKVKPVVELSVARFKREFTAISVGVSAPDRSALIDRSLVFLGEALDSAAKDLMLTCIFPVDEERVRKATEDFLMFRACQSYVKTLK